MIGGGRRYFVRSPRTGSVPASTAGAERGRTTRTTGLVPGRRSAGDSPAQWAAPVDQGDVAGAAGVNREALVGEWPLQNVPVDFVHRPLPGDRYPDERRADSPAPVEGADRVHSEMVPRPRYSSALTPWLAVGIFAGGFGALVWHRRRLPALLWTLRRELRPPPSGRRLLVTAVAGSAPSMAPVRVATRRLSEGVSGVRRPPRLVSFITVKRFLPRLGDTYGHWWVELDSDESYGWWPQRCPLRIPDAVFGVHGRLNAVGTGCRGGTITRDPHHGEHADFAFHPTLLIRKSNRRLRSDIRAFAQTYAGEWRWSPRRSGNCRSFQLELFEAVGLTDGPSHYETRGFGCPFMRDLRTAKAWVTALGTGHQPAFALIPPPLRPLLAR